MLGCDRADRKTEDGDRRKPRPETMRGGGNGPKEDNEEVELVRYFSLDSLLLFSKVLLVTVTVSYVSRGSECLVG